MISEHELAVLPCICPSACFLVQASHSPAPMHPKRSRRKQDKRFASFFTSDTKYIFKVVVLLFQRFVAFLFGIGRELSDKMGCKAVYDDSLNNALFVRLPLLRAANVQNPSKTPTAPSFWFSLWTVRQTGREESDWIRMLRDREHKNRMLRCEDWMHMNAMPTNSLWRAFISCTRSWFCHFGD